VHGAVAAMQFFAPNSLESKHTFKLARIFGVGMNAAFSSASHRQGTITNELFFACGGLVLMNLLNGTQQWVLNCTIF
jgi:hypothetical protein